MLEDYQRDALMSYTGNGFRSLNLGLRRGKVSKHAMQIDNLMKPLEYDMHLYRAMDMAEIKGSPKYDRIYHQLGFMSCSLDKDMKFGLARRANVWAEMFVPAGTNAIIVGDMLDDRIGHCEQEIILERGIKWQITHAKRDQKIFLKSLVVGVDRFATSA